MFLPPVINRAVNDVVLYLTSFIASVYRPFTDLRDYCDGAYHPLARIDRTFFFSFLFLLFYDDLEVIHKKSCFDASLPHERFDVS